MTRRSEDIETLRSPRRPLRPIAGGNRDRSVTQEAEAGWLIA